MPISRVLEAAPRSMPPAGTGFAAKRRAPRSVAQDGVPASVQPFAAVGAAGAIVILTILNIRLGMSSEGVVVIWLANAFATGVWLRAGKGLAFDLSFGGLVFGALLTSLLLLGYRPLPGFLMAGTSAIEVIVAVLLLRRFAPGQNLATVRSTVMVIGLAALIAPMISGVFGALALWWIKGTPLASGFQMWWFGHALGMVLILPIILGLNGRQTLATLRVTKILEWAGLLFGLFAVAFGFYVLRLGPMSFLLNAFMVVIAIRLRMTGVVLAMLSIAVLMFASLLHGPVPGPVAHLESTVRIMSGQLMLLSFSLPFLTVAALLTERDALWERAKTGQRRAEQASESKSRLLANVAHEIKSPVAGVIGIGELWSSGQLGPVNATQKEMADMLVKTARQVETLAHDLLDVARAESGAVKVELRPTDVVGVVEDVCRSTAMRPDARGLSVTVEGDSVGLVARADSQRLTQVVDNFATNAVKYGATGGSVTFRAMRVPFGVRIEVSDNGPGLTPEKQAQLFEPFNRLGLERSTVEGHGIGLALAKRLVELQGGTIGVESAPSQGATFWVELPAA